MDTELEKAIDGIGRERVFQRAREVGWRYGEDPPKWVWWGIIAQLRAATHKEIFDRQQYPNAKPK